MEWHAPVYIATTSWALSSICCDYAIRESSGGDSDKQKEDVPNNVSKDSEESSLLNAESQTKKRAVTMVASSSPSVEIDAPSLAGYTDDDLKDIEKSKLSGEQAALVSGGLSLFIGLFLLMYYVPSDIMSISRMRPGFFWLSFLSGIPHYICYIPLLKAYESEGSTVITPLLQLSALFLLPMSNLLSWSMENVTIEAEHLMGFILIFIGGFFPAAEGKLGQLMLSSFWKKDAVIYCIISEALNAFYSVILHIAIFDLSDNPDKDVMNFFILTQLGSGLTALLCYIFSRKWRELGNGIMVCARKYVLVTVVGEGLALFGVFIVNLSYALFYEPSVVNAAEGAIQQLINLVFVIVLKKFFNIGRPVTHLNEKILSFVLVLFGLLLTAA